MVRCPPTIGRAIVLQRKRVLGSIPRPLGIPTEKIQDHRALNGGVDGGVQALWDGIAPICNRVLHRANRYGFSLMGLPKPNVADMAATLRPIVLPVLEGVVESGRTLASRRD